MYFFDVSKKDLKWLSKGLNKKDIREFCKCFLVKEGYVYATNGHVIHRLKCNKDELEGIYTVEGIKIDTNLKHPLMKREMVEKDYYKQVILNINLNKFNEYIVSETKSINAAYFNNAIDNALKVSVQTNDEENSVRIDYENRTAIIMLIERSV